MKCNICKQTITGHYIDGKIKSGSWAYMCLACHKKHGIGLGLGKGQKYDIKTGRKIEG